MEKANEYETLYEIFLSGQMSHQQFVEHLKDTNFWDWYLKKLIIQNYRGEDDNATL
jgi:hypothetical protein